MITYAEFLKRCDELKLPPRVYQQSEWEALQQAKHRTLPQLTDEEMQLAVQHAAETGKEIGQMMLSEETQKLIREKLAST